MVDELGDLERDVQPYRAKLARVEALRAAIRATFGKGDPALTYQAPGARWLCMVGPCGNQSTVDRAALVEILGPKKFAELANVSVKSLQTAVGADVLGVVVSMQPIGPRPISVVPTSAIE